jgi:hypothetical protein
MVCYAFSGFPLKRLTARTEKIKMISGTVMPTANTDPKNDGADDAEGITNCIFT